MSNIDEMAAGETTDSVCVIIGASHGGVNFAFALRRTGWQGSILLFDADPEIPYHRPPLSKTYLSEPEEHDKALLKSIEGYAKENIALRTGIRVEAIDRKTRTIQLADGTVQKYTKLVIATGGRPIIPAIPGIETAQNVFSLRTAMDANAIRAAFESGNRKIVIIGGGYIGLESAASLKKLGADVTVVEREERVLARVTAPEMSDYFEQLHQRNGVRILTGKTVVGIADEVEGQYVICDDGARLPAELIIVGVGIHVNTELATAAGLSAPNGIKVNTTARTEDEHIYAIGDCTWHHNPHYDRYLRLESVQNAVDQAKVAAAAILGKPAVYDTIPWFWSDQYDVKFQMVGLSTGYDELVLRIEPEGDSRSAWYFKGEELLAVDAVNNGKAYVLGTKFIKGGQRIDKTKLADAEEAFKPANLILKD